ncbi:hypothetical protein EVAR_71373_1 [Eumeta japonica]|uniref:Uncharacterized protein n=1 Tax=Eumeta variegata TaxID=151549 RepID=A0A4C1SYK6_EUMVA|nr:hypothetical protein EVAR_71373_1 [Eumeta japonica]
MEIPSFDDMQSLHTGILVKQGSSPQFMDQSTQTEYYRTEQGTQTEPFTGREQLEKIHELEIKIKDLENQLKDCESLADGMNKIFTKGQIRKIISPRQTSMEVMRQEKEKLSVTEIVTVLAFDEMKVSEMYAYDAVADIVESPKNFFTYHYNHIVDMSGPPKLRDNRFSVLAESPCAKKKRNNQNIIDLFPELPVIQKPDPKYVVMSSTSDTRAYKITLAFPYIGH